MKAAARQVIAILATSLAFQASLPPVDLGVLGWIAFVPSLLVSKGRGFAVGFGTGMAVVLLSALLARFGLWCPASLKDGDPGWIFAGFFVFGIPVGLLHGILGDAKATNWATPVVFAAWAVFFEALTLAVLPGHWALTQWRNPLMLALSSVTGIWGVSFVGWLANLALAEAISNPGRRAKLIVLSAVALPMATNLIHGSPSNGDKKAVAVQTENYERSRYLQAVIGRNDGAEIVVWPELAGVAFAVMGDPAHLIEVGEKSGATPFATSFEDDFRPKKHNTMSIFGPGGQKGMYFKAKLFGGERDMRTPGTSVAHEGPYALNICFDSCFPAWIRRSANQPGVKVILLPTLDPRSPFGVAQSLHAAYTPFRAAETGTPIVRADATARSLVVDEHGTVTAMAGIGTDEDIVGNFGEPISTVYSKFGDWFFAVCGLIALIPVAAKLKSRVKTVDCQN